MISAMFFTTDVPVRTIDDMIRAAGGFGAQVQHSGDTLMVTGELDETQLRALEVMIRVDDEPATDEPGPGEVLDAVARAMSSMSPAVRRALIYEMDLWVEDACAEQEREVV